jgi:glycosyltransferase involved in cell wall biosynthesis
LIGEGALKEEIQRQAAEKGIEDSVYFLGVRSDIPQILGSLDLFVFPSVYEGLGIVLVEAQAAGIPCLVSDAIPVEADLGLGLVQFKSLDALTSEWAQALLKLESHKVPIWEKRKAALQDAGYDIHSSAKLLQDIYLTG